MQDKKNLTPEDKKLIEAASNHIKERYKKDFISIGAALRTRSGKIYLGTNIKYHVRNLSTCAEMLTIYKALDEGEEEFDTVVGVRYLPDSDSFIVVNGCGKCRQLFCYHKPLKIIIDNNGMLEAIDADKLLPYAFT